MPYNWGIFFSYANKRCRIKYKEMAQIIEDGRKEIIAPSGYYEPKVDKCLALFPRTGILYKTKQFKEKCLLFVEINDSLKLPNAFHLQSLQKH